MVAAVLAETHAFAQQEFRLLLADLTYERSILQALTFVLLIALIAFLIVLTDG
jgi:hypothetical protein